jgi:hypothetical protein
MKRNIASQLGFWASVLGVIIGGIYLLVLIYAISTDGLVSLASPSPFVQLAGGIGTFLTVPTLVVLFTAIRYVHEEDNQVLGSLGAHSCPTKPAKCANRFDTLFTLWHWLSDVCPRNFGLGFLLFTGRGICCTSVLILPAQQHYSLVIYSICNFLIPERD